MFYNQRYLIFVSFICLALTSSTVQATTFYVESQREFDDAHDRATLNDSIVWRSGTYSDIYMDIEKDRLFITTENLGGTIFTGTSRVDLEGDHITFQGFQFLDGDIGTEHVVDISGSYTVFTQINIRAYTCYKYLIVRSESQFVQITYCNFENRLNLDDQNILSILVDDNEPGFHKIQYCSFKNFDGIGKDMGIEPIRIGLSTQGDFISRTLVEFCYFKECNGDGEIISNKARQNVFRFNTFENNPLAELVLRHGSEAIVYSNFFLNGKGGIRVREGQDHYIYNNYFFDLDDRAIYLQNDESDPLEYINIAFNTIINCSEIILGGDGDYPPQNVTFSNNIFAQPKDDLFEEPTQSETWINNISNGDLGIGLPSNGLKNIDPELEENGEGFFGLSENSPAIDAAQAGYALLPQYDGMEPIDTEILFDLMGQKRPANIDEKDLGCSEFPHDTVIRPYATESNTGPSYNTSVITKVNETNDGVENQLQIKPNPTIDEINITVFGSNGERVILEIFNLNGKKMNAVLGRINGKEKFEFSKNIEDFPAGSYNVKASVGSIGNKRIHNLQFIKLK